MGKQTIQDIAAILIEKNGFERRDASQFASAMFALIQERLETDRLVKVKGLGTFKIIGVEARESVSVRTGERFTINSHAKVSFIPDTAMKELVNRPFSQFETVVLNDGVEFDDLMDEAPAKKPSREEPVTDQVEEEPVTDQIEEESVTDQVEEEPAQVPVEEEPAPVPVEEVTVETPESQPLLDVVEEPSSEEAETPAPEEPSDDEEEEEEEEERPWGRWLLCALGVLALMALSAWGGYYYGTNQAGTAAVADTVYVHDTVTVAPADTLSAVEAAATPEPPKTTVAPEPEKPATAPNPKQVAPAPDPKKSAPVADAKKPEPIDKYAAKDDRVRLGAYRIVGLDQEVKVLAGQTFYSICRAYLGPDMECYVEVFNDLPRHPKIKEGQVIKIPKLEVKKRRKQN